MTPLIPPDTPFPPLSRPKFIPEADGEYEYGLVIEPPSNSFIINDMLSM